MMLDWDARVTGNGSHSEAVKVVRVHGPGIVTYVVDTCRVLGYGRRVECVM